MPKKKKKIDTKFWMHAVCHLSVVPLRMRASDDDLMISQLIFGELCQVIEKKNKHWYKIQTQDMLIAWVRTAQITMIDENLYQKLQSKRGIALDVCSSALHDENHQMIVVGSFLPLFDGMSFIMPDGNYVYNGLAKGVENDFTLDIFLKIVRRYLNAPELKGGKSPFGIDAAALTQMSFRYLNIYLPRFTTEQVKLGDLVDFIELAQPGDLLFFGNTNDAIEHVAIYMGEKKAIHVYGCVRIDKVDHYGLFNTGLEKYTHKLRTIKRILHFSENDIA